MNTIKSNLQFFVRASEKFEDKICVLNSKKPTSEEECIKHSNNVNGIRKYALSGAAEIIVMCAHKVRFDESILNLIDILEDSKKFNKKVTIHIDEAHAYVPMFRDHVITINNYNVVEQIYLYSATPFNIWDPNSTHRIFRQVYIVDVEEQFNIKKSEKYFGIENCKHIIDEDDGFEMVDYIVPKNVIDIYNILHNKSIENDIWYENNSPFQLGNEYKYLNYVAFTLKALKMYGNVSNDKFSYNFIPGYIRVMSHYGISDIILKRFNKAVVVVINGDGTYEFTKDESTNMKLAYKPIPHNKEPSEQILYIKNKYPNRPLFVTGFHCVSMSVTLINEELGNFDNVIISHDQFINQPDRGYQCVGRFLFNYINWKDPDSIKETKIHTNSGATINACIEYERQIDVIMSEMSGSLREQGEVCGKVKVKPTKKIKERKNDKIEKYSTIHKPKTFSVTDEDEEEEIWIKACEYYKGFTGKKLKGKSKPKINEGLYRCSTTGKAEVQTDVSSFKNTIKGWKWDSNFALTKDQYKYARVYVVYDDPEDKYDYSIIIRTMELENNEEVNQLLVK